jgi:hypothetical protein
MKESSICPSLVSILDMVMVFVNSWSVPLIIAKVTFQLPPDSLKFIETVAESSELDGPIESTEYLKTVPSRMLEPTTQMSSGPGGSRGVGPCPVKPPPIAIMAALTPIPSAANIPVTIATRRFGDTSLTWWLWLI